MQQQFDQFVTDIIGKKYYEYLKCKREDPENWSSDVILNMFELLNSWNDLEIDERVIIWHAAEAMLKIYHFPDHPFDTRVLPD